nr:hypothetical protein [Tanacetum cinerariifolium]
MKTVECKASEGLVDGKASTSNLKDTQVKDIVKEFEDYLKTYSPTEMDIRCRGGYQVTNVLEFNEEDFSSWKDRRKVNGTFTRLRSLLNDLENNGVSISQAEVNATFVNSLPRKWLKSSRFTLQGSKALISNPTVQESDSDIEEDQRSSSELLADLNDEFHERDLLANQRRFYKSSERMGSQKKSMDRTKAKSTVLTKKIDAINKGKNEKGLVAESFNKDEESVSFDDEGVTTFKALMVVADELSVGRVDVWALTIQPSAMYAKYLKEFWYTAKVENNIITFLLSHVEKPLSFNHDLFSSVIGLDYAKKFESLPSHEDVKEGLPTLGLTDEKSPNLSSVALSQSSSIRITYFSPTWKILMTYIVKCLGGNQGSHDQLNFNQQMIAYALYRDLKIDITCILFNDLVTKLSAGGKKGMEKNVCYVRYMSIILEHLLGKYYLNDDLKPMKSYQMTDATFKNSKILRVSTIIPIFSVYSESVPEDDTLGSVSESKTFKSKEDDTHSQHIELSKFEERYADKLIEELADMNASAEKPSLSDPLSHLCNEVSNLTTKDMVAILDSTSVFAKANAEGEKGSNTLTINQRMLSILSKPADKGKAIATKEDPTKELIPLLEESGSSPKISELKLFSSDGGQMTINKAKAQIEELRKIKLLKAKKEKSDKERLKKLNHVKEQTLKLAEYEAKRSKMIREYDDCITKRLDLCRLQRLTIQSKNMLGLTYGFEVHALSSEGKGQLNINLLKSLKAKIQWEDIKVDGMHKNLVPPRGVIGSPGLVITEPEAGIFYYNGNFDLVFQRENEFHLASITQLIKQLKHIKRDTPEA